MAVACAALLLPAVAMAVPPDAQPSITTLTTGLQGASGSAIGPDGALYVPEGALGTIARVDPNHW